jgi:hypothetical protein
MISPKNHRTNRKNRIPTMSKFANVVVVIKVVLFMADLHSRIEKHIAWS